MRASGSIRTVPMASITPEFVAKFNGKIDKELGPSGCWIWTGSTNRGRYHGYGTVTIPNGSEYTSRSGRRISATHQAHRVSWAIANGRWPSKLILHACDVKSCVNPVHLREGTHADNVYDLHLARLGVRCLARTNISEVTS